VVASRVVGIASVVTNEVSLLLVSPRRKNLTKTIINLLNDQDKLHETGLKGRKIAEAHDWKQIAKKTEGLYREALEDSQTRLNYSCPVTENLICVSLPK